MNGKSDDRSETGRTSHLYSERIKGAYFPLYPLYPYDSCSKGQGGQLQLLQLLSAERSDSVPCALYIHIPFCESFCAFCGIPKLYRSENIISRYLSALKKEIFWYAQSNYILSSEFDALYFGGGTPTVLTSEQLADLISYCKGSFALRKDAEITVEGCVHNFGREKLEAVLEAGANRVSFGVQTFNDALRDLIDLQSEAEDCIQAVDMARDAGYQRIDIDLIYNLPGQTSEDVKNDVQLAISLALDNVSFYALHIEPGTKLDRQIRSGESSISGIDEEVAMYQDAVRLFEQAGYHQQSILTKFSLPYVDCVYEKMRLGQYDCLALGPSGNGNLGDCVYSNMGSVNDYLQMVEQRKFPVSTAVQISSNQAIRRYLAKEISIFRIDKEDFQRRFCIYPEDVFPELIESLEIRGLIETDDRLIKLTPWGRLWGQNVCSEFLR